jgi:hypothetical protein
MTILTDIAKHNAPLTQAEKVSAGEIFFGWMFWFTHPIFNDVTLVAVVKHSGALTNVSKH